MQNDKAFFTILIQTGGFHQSMASGSPVSGGFVVNVAAEKAFLTVVAAGLRGGGVGVAAIEADEFLIDFNGFGHT